jgi:hypothetical protein
MQQRKLTGFDKITTSSGQIFNLEIVSRIRQISSTPEYMAVPDELLMRDLECPDIQGTPEDLPTVPRMPEFEDSPDGTNENVIDMTCAVKLINKIFDLGWKLSGSALRRGPIDRLFTEEVCVSEERFNCLYWQVHKVAKTVINCEDFRSVGVIIIATAFLSKGARNNTAPLVLVNNLEEASKATNLQEEADTSDDAKSPKERPCTSNCMKSLQVTGKFHLKNYLYEHGRICRSF